MTGPTNHHACEGLGVECVGTLAEKEREKRGEIAGAIHHRRCRQQEHLRARAQLGESAVALGAGCACVMCFIYDDEWGTADMRRATQRLERNELNRSLGARRSGNPLCAQRRRRGHDHALGACGHSERDDCLPRAGRICEQRPTELGERGVNSLHGGALGVAKRVATDTVDRTVRCKHSIGNQRTHRIGALDRARNWCGERAESPRHVSAQSPCHESSGAIASCVTPYASSTCSVSVHSSVGSPRAASRPSGARIARARSHSRGIGNRAQVQPK